MSLRPSLRTACRALALRSRPLTPRQESFTFSIPRRRYADDSGPIPPVKPPGGLASNSTASEPPQNTRSAENSEIPAERQAASGKPAIAEEKTEDVSTANEAVGGQEDSVILEGGLTLDQEETLLREGSIPPPSSTNGDLEGEIELLASRGIVIDSAGNGSAEPEYAVEPQRPGFKFPPPTLPLPPQSHLKDRYHPVLSQLTNLMMRDGKKSIAQRNMALLLNFLRTSPSPIINPRFPLLPGAPPPSHLPLNPVLYLVLAIDSVAPLIRIRYIKGGAGGGQNLEMPVPLAVRQRRRQAFQWLLDVVDKKSSQGSGRTQLAHRIAQEVVAVVEGRSPLWERRLAVHKVATASRANLTKKVIIRKGPK